MKRSWRSFGGHLGPGLVTGASDDDPAGIVTYTQAGAQFGFAPLWLAVFTVPLMIAVQETCARIALVARTGLFGLFRRYFPRWLGWLLALLFVGANVFNIAADLNMMAASMALLLPGSRWFWIGAFAVGSFALQVFLSYASYAKVLRWLVLSLMAYVGVLFFVKMPWSQAFLATLIPQPVSSAEYLLVIIAILGTTLSPYLYVWQAAEEVEETADCERHARASGAACGMANREQLPQMRFDVSFGMVVSNVIFWCIVAAAAATLHGQGITAITGADQAALVLRPFLGPIAVALFVLGIVGTGLLTIPVLAGSAAYAVAELKSWRSSLNDTWKEAPLFYGVLALCMGGGVLLNVWDLPPIQMLIWSAILNALLAPPLLLAILWLANHRKVMGTHRNGRWANVVLGIALLVMTVAALVWAYLTLQGR